ncbi:MAG: hypothetical protein LAO22_04415 [Acidobacteriia bacterium]|nr:hypothetical protein [Terriglobia bacterium]
MKLSRCLFAYACTLTLVVSGFAAAKDKENEHEGQKVDSGSFGVFIGGHRVGTETFSIYQSQNGSVIESEFKTEGSAAPAATQDSEMRLTGSGEIRRYDWRELSPGKSQLTIVPNDQFLMQKWIAGPQEKEGEQPYLLPPSTAILDDYFFVHREVLAWKFLGMACKQEKGQVQCPVKQRVKFATLNPHQHSSAPGTMVALGREKAVVKGTEQELIKLELTTDSGTWYLWVDDHDQFKLMRISIEGENTEVLRD